MSNFSFEFEGITYSIEHFFDTAQIDAFQKAYDKAQAVKPHIREIGFAKYLVRASDGFNNYLVVFKKGGVMCEAGCSCPSKYRCYHIAACMGHLKLRVQERKAAQAAAQAEKPLAPVIPIRPSKRAA